MLDCEGAINPKAGLVREDYWLKFQKYQTRKMGEKLTKEWKK